MIRKIPDRISGDHAERWKEMPAVKLKFLAVMCAAHNFHNNKLLKKHCSNVIMTDCEHVILIAYTIQIYHHCRDNNSYKSLA